MDLQKRIAIVTGANKGLGFAMVKTLCEKYNGRVYLTSRDEGRGKDACAKLEALGLQPVYHQLDVGDEESIARFASHIRKQNGKLEILINNAGILFRKDSKEPKQYQAEQTVGINFFGLVNVCEALIPSMAIGGRIVNISSSSGHLSRLPSNELRSTFNSDISVDELKKFVNIYLDAVKSGNEIECSPYVISKVAVNSYTLILYRRLRPQGIVVVSVHPGYVMSEMTSGAGNVTPEKAAELPVQLALQQTRGMHEGLFFWHNGHPVPWDGPDPRGYIDGMQV